MSGEQLLELLRSAYLNFEEPSFHFVSLHRAHSLSEKVRASLPESVGVRDQTDLNYDVCVSLRMERNGKRGDLLVSLVGPFATLVDLSAPSDEHTTIASEATPAWQDVIAALAADGISYLSAQGLRQPVPLRLALSGKQCVLFNALFRDQHATTLVD